MNTPSTQRDAQHNSNKNLPWYMQILLVLGWPFGYRRVSGRQVMVVYRWGRFFRLAGPRTYRLRWFEHQRNVVNLAPTHRSFSIPSLMTSDGLLYEIVIELEYHFDPREVPDDQVMKMIRRCEMPGGVDSIVKSQAQLVLQEIFADYKAELIAQADIRARIQKGFLEALKHHLKEYALFLNPRDCYIREWHPPASLIEGMEDAARRLVDVQNLSLLTGDEFSREVRMKAVEALKHMIHGMPQLNLDALVQDNNVQARDAARETMRQIIVAQSRPIQPGPSTTHSEAPPSQNSMPTNLQPSIQPQTSDDDESRL